MSNNTMWLKIKFSALFLILFFMSQITYAEIFHCSVQNDKTLYKDSECFEKETEVCKIVYTNTPLSSGSGDASTTKRGFATVYTRISLNSSANDTEKSDILSLQLWHYNTEKCKNKANRIRILPVPYK